MSMDIEKSAKDWKESSSEQKTHLVASGIGAIVGGYLGGYPGMQIGMAIAGWIFRPTPPKSKDYSNQENKLYRSKLDPVPDVIGTDMCPGKPIWINKNTLGVYDSRQLPNMVDEENEIKWKTFIDMISAANIGQWAEFAIDFASQYNGNMHHIGVMYLNGKPLWFWTMLSDMFENYESALTPNPPMTLIDGGQDYWFGEINVEDYINQPVKNDMVVYFRGFLADFSALSTDPAQSNVMIDLDNMAEMNPGEFQMGGLNTFPTFTAEINRYDVDMSGESTQGGKGMVSQDWFYDETYPDVKKPIYLGTYWNNANGKYNKLVGVSGTTQDYPAVGDPVEGTVTFPGSDYSGTMDSALITAWLNNNIHTGYGSYIQCTDIFDDRQYVCAYRNWYNPNQGRGVFGIDKVNHHHAEYGIEFDLYWHDMTRDDCKVHSLIYNQQYSMTDGDYNPRLYFSALQVDSNYIYIFGGKIQNDFVYSDQREIESGANSYTKCYADFSQYPNGYWEDYYAALQQDGFLKWCKVTEQTSTYIEVNDEQGGLTGGWGKVPEVGEVVYLKKFPTSDCGFAIAGEGSTTSTIICNPPSPTDMCSPSASVWEKAGFAGEQLECSYDDEDDTTIQLTGTLSRAPNPGEIIYFTDPDQEYDEDIVNPLLGSGEINLLLDLGFTNPYVRWQSIVANEFSSSHKFILRVNKTTGAIDEYWSDRIYHPHQYGFYWWTGSLNYYTCQTDQQAFVYINENLYGTNFAAHSFIIDFSSGIEEEVHIQNQYAASHTPWCCYHGTVSVKEWNGSAWVNAWYAILTAYDSFEGLNDSINRGNYFLKLGEGKFSNKKVVSSNIPLYYGLDISRRGIKKILYRKDQATGPLYGGIYTSSYPNDNTYPIGKISLHNTIYFHIYKGNHITIYPTNELWKFVPPSDSNPSGVLYMLHKTRMEVPGEGAFQWNRIDTTVGFRQVISGFYGKGTGIWYHCDESPPNIILEFWNDYVDPSYFPSSYKWWLGYQDALAICNEYIPVKYIRPEGTYEFTERRFQFSKAYTESVKMHDVIMEILETCQGFISPCTWNTVYDWYFKLIVPNKDETPVHYFGRETAIFTSNQASALHQYIYADFSAYPDNFWKGDEINFGEVMDLALPYPDSQYNVVIEQTPTYIKLGIALSGYWPNGKQFTLIKDNIKEGSFTFAEKSAMNRPNKVRIEFIDRMDGYTKSVAEAEDAYRLDVLGEIEKIDFYKMHGIKRASQAGRLAQRILDQWNYQKYVCGFETDILGMTLCMGEIIAVKNEVTGWNYRWFRIMAMEEMIDFEVKFELEEFNPFCYHDSGVPVIQGHAYGGFPAPYQPQQVENFTVHEDIEFNRLYFTFDPPEYDAGFFVGARIYHKVGSDYEYIAIITETVSSAKLAQDVSEDDTIIYYDPDYISGSFPSEGVIWIENELIYYHGIDTTNYAFTNVVRGYKDTAIVEHLIEDGIYLKLRNDATQYYEMPSGWEGTTQTFKAASFTIQSLTAPVDTAPSADIDIVGYGLLPYFPESIHKPISEIPETNYLFESLGISSSLDETERIIEALGLGDDLNSIESISETLGLSDSVTVKEFLVRVAETLGLDDTWVVYATEYITETLGLGDDLEAIDEDLEGAMMVLQGNIL